MPDGFTRVRQGERRPIYGQISVSSGTVTIASSPAPTATLYDATGTVVTGFNGVGISGNDTGGLSNPRLWFNLDTSGLTAGYYTLVFSTSATGSDGTARRYTPTVEVEIVAVGR